MNTQYLIISLLILCFVSCGSETDNESEAATEQKVTELKEKDMEPKCLAENQPEFENAIHELTLEYLEKYDPLNNNQNNTQYVNEYVQRTNEILCYNSRFTFKGEVIKIDSTYMDDLLDQYEKNTGNTKEFSDSVYAESRYLLKISSQSAGSKKPQEKIFEYNFSFGTNSPLLQKLLKVEAGDKIVFTFQFEESLLDAYLQSRAMMSALGKGTTGPTFLIDIEKIEKI